MDVGKRYHRRVNLCLASRASPIPSAEPCTEETVLGLLLFLTTMAYWNLLRWSDTLNLRLLISGSGQLSEASLYTENTGRPVFTLTWALQLGWLEAYVGTLRAVVGRQYWGGRHGASLCMFLFRLSCPNIQGPKIIYKWSFTAWSSKIHVAGCTK